MIQPISDPSFSREFNTRDHYIGLCWLEVPGLLWQERKFIKVVSDAEPIDEHGSFDDWMMTAVPDLWRAKYGEEIKATAPYATFSVLPDNRRAVVVSGWAETILLGAFKGDGPRDISDAEWAIVDREPWSTNNLTYSEFWIISGLLGWKLGMARNGHSPSQEEADRFYAFYRQGGAAMPPEDDHNIGSLFYTALLAIGVPDAAGEAAKLLPQCMA